MALTTYIPLSILRIFFPSKEPNHIRTKPLEVLALGFSRSGTDSLRNALLKLGYGEVYHGFVYAVEIGSSVQWIRMKRAKENNYSPLNNPQSNPGPQTPRFTAEDFDKVIGHCNAVTDMPACCFGPELISAYPNAKVILNRREDADAWEKSVEATLNTVYKDWYQWFRSFFNEDLFWICQSFEELFSDYFKGDFDGLGKRGYLAHYERLEEALKGQEERILRWKVQDGWEPLCNFLEKPIPEIEFPDGNVSEAFQARRLRTHMPRIQRAHRRMRITAVVLTASLAMFLGWKMKSA